MKASEVLLKAADVLRERGHTRWVLQDGAGAVCLSGAVRVALCGDPISWSDEVLPLLNRVSDVVGLNVDNQDPYVGNSAAVDWNNNVATTGQVIAALDAAAVVALQEEGLDPADVLK